MLSTSNIISQPHCFCSDARGCFWPCGCSAAVAVSSAFRAALQALADKDECESKAAGSHTAFRTHTPRKLMWTSPSPLRPVFWVWAAILTVAVLVYIPKMPDLTPHPLHTVTSPTSGMHLPPTLEFNPPQWFDPPHRDQVYWLGNVARAVSHSTRVSWQVITSKFPMSPPSLVSPSQSFDSPTSPFLGYDIWQSMSSWHSISSAGDLHLNPTANSLDMPESSALPTSPSSIQLSALDTNTDSKIDNAIAVALWTPQGSPPSVNTCLSKLVTAVALWQPGQAFTGIGSILTVGSPSTIVAVWRVRYWQSFGCCFTCHKYNCVETGASLPLHQHFSGCCFPNHIYGCLEIRASLHWHWHLSSPCLALHSCGCMRTKTSPH